MARKRGAPPYQPTDEAREKVREYTAVGVPQTDIAAVLGISVNTLKKYFTNELKTSSIKANAAVAGKLYSLCMAGNVTAIIFWLKTRMSDVYREQNADDDDTPPPVKVIIEQRDPDAAKPVADSVPADTD